MSFLTTIVPCLDEEAHLATLLPTLTAAGERVIVVDGGSRDGSVPLARGMIGVEVLETTPPRSHQMNRGAAAATGEALLFLHADAVPPPAFARCIATALADPAVAGGAFDLALDAPGLAPWLVARGASWRSRLTGRPYGDQGIFVRRSVFDAMGGFVPWPLLEDLEFTHRLRRHGRVCLLRQRVTVSARRWQAQGYLRTTLRNVVLAGCFYLGIDPGPFARWAAPVRDHPTPR